MAQDDSKASAKIERVVFFGAGLFAIYAFEALLEAGLKIVLLVTGDAAGEGERGPDSVAGPWHIPIIGHDDAAAGRDLEQRLREMSPDIQISVGYRQTIPKAVLGIPRHGTIQLHSSLLPRHRGDQSVKSAILAGDAETGMTTALVTDKPDGGPILLARKVTIGEEETAAELAAKLGPVGAELLVETVRGLESGALKPVPQDESRATLSPTVGPDPVTVDWTQTAEQISRQVRAYNPRPLCRSQIDGIVLSVMRALPAGESTEPPGTLVRSGYDGLYVACGGKTMLRVTQLQPEGQKPMAPATFVTKYRVGSGGRFE
jgi:methionyl-tRNA formyltransferase